MGVPCSAHHKPKAWWRATAACVKIKSLCLVLNISRSRRKTDERNFLGTQAGSAQVVHLGLVTGRVSIRAVCLCFGDCTVKWCFKSRFLCLGVLLQRLQRCQSEPLEPLSTFRMRLSSRLEPLLIAMLHREQKQGNLHRIQ